MPILYLASKQYLTQWIFVRAALFYLCLKFLFSVEALVEPKILMFIFDFVFETICGEQSNNNAISLL